MTPRRALTLAVLVALFAAASFGCYIGGGGVLPPPDAGPDASADDAGAEGG